MANARVGTQKNSAAAKTTDGALVSQLKELLTGTTSLRRSCSIPPGYQSDHLAYPALRGASSLRLTRFGGSSSKMLTKTTELPLIDRNAPARLQGKKSSVTTRKRE